VLLFLHTSLGVTFIYWSNKLVLDKNLKTWMMMWILVALERVF